MKILIVDDSEMVRNFHCYILKSNGFQVMTAVDGADALEKIYTGENKIDLIITDINMPNMDGYSLVERLREDPDFETVPVIIVSTEDEARDKTRGFEAGADIYIVKPTEPELLVENVFMLLGKE